METGLVHVYTGDGKGKTTAAIGLAVRALGAGGRVLFAQFMKGGETGELEVFQKLENIHVMRCQKHFPFYSQMTNEQKKEQRKQHDKMLCEIVDTVRQHRIDVLVLDEITYPCRWGLIDVEQVKQLLTLAEGKIEVVCTGRDPEDWLLDRADYITNMQAVRHPFEKGIGARAGVEY